MNPLFSLCATRSGAHKQWVIGTEVPASLGRRGRKVRSLPAGDEERLRPRIGPAGRGAGRASLSCAKRGVPRDAGDAKGDWSKKGRGRKWNPSSDWDPRPEATPELVSQDRGAGDLRVAKADEHRRILRSAQMGAGSNAGPHFSLWRGCGQAPCRGRRPGCPPDPRRPSRTSPCCSIR